MQTTGLQRNKVAQLITGAILIALFVTELNAYRVVLDPGHGGRFTRPISVYGDKFDPLTGRFLEGYRPGAYYEGLFENEVAYSIAEQTREILSLTATEEGRKEFLKILRKYDPHARIPEESIEVFLSRKPGYRQRYDELGPDMNKDYRLYDHYTFENNTHIPGTLSRINALEPHLVVTLHFTNGTTAKYGGMSSVVTPSYHFFEKAINYVSADPAQRVEIKKEFEASPFKNWFQSRNDRSIFEWFLCDAWIYFTGYWSKPDGLSYDPNNYRGYRQNMVSWNYKDPNWPKAAKNNPANSPYSNDLRSFRAEGKFWEREKGQPEIWRREGGEEGYGGDNHYASNELLRYIRQGLLVNHLRGERHLPVIEPPYISTWTVPTYINAVSAYLEIGYLSNKYDYGRITNYRREHAEALAVGIYSLFYGLNQKDYNSKKQLPKGKPVDFVKYINYNGGNYFTMPTGN